MQPLQNEGAYQGQLLEETSFSNAHEIQRQETEKAGAAVEEEHLLLLFINVCDNNIILDTGASMMYMQVDIQEAYHFTTIDYGFGNVIDEDDIPDLEAPTKCEDKEKVSELKISCANEARLNNK
jgi:hypothetical protein